MTHKKEIEILEDSKKLTLYIKQGFTQKASILQEIRQALQTFPLNKKVSIYLAPQFEDTHSAVDDIRRQLIALKALEASVSSRSSVRFHQTYKNAERKIHCATYKLTSSRGVCSIKLDSYKHPIEAYDNTAKEIAFVLTQDRPSVIQVLFRPAAKESLEAFKNRINGFERFLKQTAVEIPEVQEILIWNKLGGKPTLLSQTKRKNGQLVNIPVFVPNAPTPQKPVPNTQIVSKYRLKQQRKESELQRA